MQQDLVERAMSHDQEAFSELASASIGRLYAVAFLILHDRDRAQDAVQEALVSAWKDMRALRDPGAWDAWLYRLAVRACYKQAQKDRRRTQVELQVLPGPEPARPFDLSVSIAERDAMEYELGRLPIDQRAVMVLHFYADVTLERTAEILDIPVGTAKSRLNRGLVALRESMSDEPTVAAGQDRGQTA
jgi:RNA polymerase sigma-70 factor (ECF subfamily)